MPARGDFEIGRILHLKSEIRDIRLDYPALEGSPVQLEISDFGFEMQDSSNFKISFRLSPRRVKYVSAPSQEGSKNMKKISVYRPTTIEEAIQILSLHGTEAGVYAGGTDLLIRLKNLRLSANDNRRSHTDIVAAWN